MKDWVFENNTWVTSSSEDKSKIDVEALILFKENTKEEIMEFRRREIEKDNKDAECEEDKLSQKQLNILERAIEFHNAYFKARLSIKPKLKEQG